MLNKRAHLTAVRNLLTLCAENKDAWKRVVRHATGKSKEREKARKEIFENYSNLFSNDITRLKAIYDAPMTNAEAVVSVCDENGNVVEDKLRKFESRNK